ncbi:peptidylprolyl isomerase [Methyloversatilis sp.]|uniref:peptidylprolyl isomerase n=1 Tax=Methyloversatilis sp. TaxID=2569862 RepID=UPI002733110A|nr:peptidylprolyl isomerase [Methyloversatilis sp.]MDP2867729.1 peptidylprolyl isomerase [Methyloversatilis sp.]MDP3455506.1 peptidylprolyl isomerase [Methyloversatilis sp.]MDP3579999.1 peptidylprolyl isomerase [Methyloversatilis sp.]
MKKFLLALLASLVPLVSIAANPQVELKTSQGPILIELFPEAAPATVANFLQYAKSGFYDGLIFHRVINGFMIQGGGFDAQMNQKAAGAPIRNEAEKAMSKGVRNAPGYLSMARTNDPHSASAQFFINLVDNRTLDYPSRDGFGYAAFAKVIKGMEVVNGIANVRTGDNGSHQNVPLTPVVIQSVRVVEAP